MPKQQPCHFRGQAGQDPSWDSCFSQRPREGEGADWGWSRQGAWGLGGWEALSVVGKGRPWGVVSQFQPGHTRCVRHLPEPSRDLNPLTLCWSPTPAGWRDRSRARGLLTAPSGAQCWRFPRALCQRRGGSPRHSEQRDDCTAVHQPSVRSEGATATPAAPSERPANPSVSRQRATAGSLLVKGGRGPTISRCFQLEDGCRGDPRSIQTTPP